MNFKLNSSANLSIWKFVEHSHNIITSTKWTETVHRNIRLTFIWRHAIFLWAYLPNTLSVKSVEQSFDLSKESTLNTCNYQNPLPKCFLPCMFQQGPCYVTIRTFQCLNLILTRSSIINNRSSLLSSQSESKLYNPKSIWSPPNIRNFNLKKGKFSLMMSVTIFYIWTQDEQCAQYNIRKPNWPSNINPWSTQTFTSFVLVNECFQNDHCRPWYISTGHGKIINGLHVVQPWHCSYKSKIFILLHILGCVLEQVYYYSICDLEKIFLAFKFSCLFFSNPTHKTKTRIANKWETTNSKPPRPIITIGQSETKDNC
jgi:hypothetical protein